MPHVDVHDARDQLPMLIERARRGEDVILTENNQPLVRLVAAGDAEQRQPGSAKGLIHIDDDFDEPLEDFQEYM